MKFTATGDGGAQVNSSRAGGLYIVNGNAYDFVTNLDFTSKMMLTTWLVYEREYVSIPEISLDVLNQLKGRTLVKMSRVSVSARADNLLRYLAAKSHLLDMEISFRAIDSRDAPETTNELLAWTSSYKVSDVVWLASSCFEKGWITYRRTTSAHYMALKFSGYERLADYS